MGKPMAKNLIKAGHSLVVHNRSRGSVDELKGAGAVAATTPAEVAAKASVVITMVPDTADVELVLEGADGVLAGLQQNTVVIDMSSISPIATKRLAARVAERGGTMLDAPVSGGEIGAINATLSIMVGGDEAAFARSASFTSAHPAQGRPARSAIRWQLGARWPASPRRSRWRERRAWTPGACARRCSAGLRQAKSSKCTANEC
jgi:6-phosphogluconate dehydrogenase (decarboxylating)